MPLREALRGLRFLMRRGGETIADTLSVDTLPKPASDVASAVLREVGGLARSVDGAASDMAKKLLGGHTSTTIPLETFILQPELGKQFAAAFYVASTFVLRHLGASTVFVSEAAARSALDSLDMRGASPARNAVDLSLRLQEARVIRGTTAREAALVLGGSLEAVTLFAVLLWLQAPRTEADNVLVLDAAIDIALALAGEIAAAFDSSDHARLEELYLRVGPHV